MPFGTRAAGLAIIAGGILAFPMGCMTPSVSPNAHKPASHVSWEQLRQRDLDLKPLRDPRGCIRSPFRVRTSEPVAMNRIPTYKAGPVLLGGDEHPLVDPFNKVPWNVLPQYQGPVLIRGALADGNQVLFSGPIEGEGTAVRTELQGKVPVSFFKEVDIPVARVPISQHVHGDHWGGGFFLFPTAPGCLLLQVDGDGFSDQLVIAPT